MHVEKCINEFIEVSVRVRECECVFRDLYELNRHVAFGSVRCLFSFKARATRGRFRFQIGYG